MERTCVGCRRVRPKASLVRIVRGPDGRVAVDSAGGAPGRGAYVCGPACLGAARGRLSRALRTERYDEDAIRGAVEAAQKEQE